jgi:hypothetical protein
LREVQELLPGAAISNACVCMFVCIIVCVCMYVYNQQCVCMYVYTQTPTNSHTHTLSLIHHAYIQDNYIYVLKLVPGGPAQLCQNIEVDDVLYKVDGTNVSGMELDQVPFLSCI